MTNISEKWAVTLSAKTAFFAFISPVFKLSTRLYSRRFGLCLSVIEADLCGRRGAALSRSAPPLSSAGELGGRLQTRSPEGAGEPGAAGETAPPDSWSPRGTRRATCWTPCTPPCRDRQLRSNWSLAELKTLQILKWCSNHLVHPGSMNKMSFLSLGKAKYYLKDLMAFYWLWLCGHQMIWGQFMPLKTIFYHRGGFSPEEDKQVVADWLSILIVSHTSTDIKPWLLTPWLRYHNNSYVCYANESRCLLGFYVK